MRRTSGFPTFFLTLFLVGLDVYARADAPPPEQALASDPERPLPRVGSSADAVGIVLGDYALRIEGAPDAWHALTLEIGASRRHGGDAMLVEVGWSVFPMAVGLEGFFVHPAAGIAWAGPWNGDAPGARSIVRFGGEVGWQFLWEDLSITLAAGAMGFVEVSGAGQGSVWPEPRGRIALGFVLR